MGEKKSRDKNSMDSSQLRFEIYYVIFEILSLQKKSR